MTLIPTDPRDAAYADTADPDDADYGDTADPDGSRTRITRGTARKAGGPQA